MTEKNFEILEEKKIQEEINSDQNLKTYKGYVGFWKRFTAQVLDNIIMIAAIPFIMISLRAFVIAIFLTTAVSIAIHAYLYFKEGRGIGYKILGYKIIDAESGEKADDKKLLKRGLIKLTLIIIADIISGFIIFSFLLKTNFLGNMENITSISDFNNLDKKAIFSDAFSGIWAIWMFINAIAIMVSAKKLAFYDKLSGVMVVADKTQKAWKLWLINIFSLFILPILAMIVLAVPFKNMMMNFITTNTDKVIEGKFDKLIPEVIAEEKRSRKEQGLPVKEEWTMETVKEEARKIKKAIEEGEITYLSDFWSNINDFKDSLENLEENVENVKIDIDIKK